MEFIKGTIQECEEYNSFVTIGEGYEGVSTSRWAEPIEIGGSFYMPLNENYPSELTTVTELPPTQETI